MRHIRKILAAAAAATLLAAPARAEIYNQFCPLPIGGFLPDEFSINFLGNLVPDINIAAMETDPSVNPFAYAIDKLGATGTPIVTATYNATTNITTVTYSGTTLLSTYKFNYGSSSLTTNDEPHFGLDGSLAGGIAGGGPKLTALSQMWSDASNNMSALPSLTVTNPNAPTSGPVNYESFYADVTSGGVSTGQWFEVPITPGTHPTLTLTNYTGMPETLSNIGFQFSTTLIPLDNLNFADSPPPGSPNSPYTPMPSLDGTMLGAGDGMGTAGGSIGFQGLPEPSGLISLGTGILLAGGFLGHRRAASRRSADG